MRLAPLKNVFQLNFVSECSSMKAMVSSMTLRENGSAAGSLWIMARVA